MSASVERLDTGSPGGRITWADSAKGIAIAVVVLGHVRAELAFVGIEAEWTNQVVGLLSTMFLVLFFMVSGLFARQARDGTWGSLCSGRLVSLLWPFLIWQPVVLAYKIIEMELLPNQPANTLVGQVGKFIVSPLRPNGELWFLWALAVFFVIAKISSKLPARIQVGIAAGISFVWLSFSAELLSAEQLRALGVGWAGVPTYYVFFLIGLLGSEAVKRFATSLSPATAGLWVTAWVIGFFAVRWLDFEDWTGVQFGLRLLGLAAGVALAWSLRSVDLVQRVGKQTLAIYLTHMPIVVVAVSALWVSGTAQPLVGAASLVIPLLTFGAIALSMRIYVALRPTRGRFIYEAPTAAHLAVARCFPRPSELRRDD